MASRYTVRPTRQLSPWALPILCGLALACDDGKSPGTRNGQQLTCNPGQIEACYSGPAGTANVGRCRPGLRVCAGDGAAWGPCIGEVMPEVERCDTPGDEDCDGTVVDSEDRCVCVPGSVMPCYSGASETMGVGACRAGVATCEPSGLAFGACAGEVVPQAEDCATPADEDCDGRSIDTEDGCVCSSGSSGLCYSGPPHTLGVGVCRGGTAICDASGTAYGACSGEVLPSPERCDTTTDEDCDGATLDQDAGCVCTPGSFTACYSGPTSTQDVGECRAGISFCLASGLEHGACLFEVTPRAELCDSGADANCDGALTSCGGSNSSDGWVVTARGFASQHVLALAADASASLFVLGLTYGTMDINGAVISKPGPALGLDPDLFVARLDRGGNVLWRTRFGDMGTQTVSAAAIDAAGDLVTAGVFSGMVDFGLGTLTSAGNYDIFLAKLDADGNALWAARFGDASSSHVPGLAVGVDGIYIGGYFGGSVDFGGGALTSGGSNDAFIAAFDADGAHRWSKRFGNALSQRALALAAQTSGEIVVAGEFAGQMDLGLGTLTNAGGGDAFLASFDSAGNLLWNKVFGDETAQSASVLATDPLSQAIFVGGTFAGTMDFGGGGLTAEDDQDAFIAMFTSNGMYLWSARLGGTGAQTLTKLVRMLDGTLVAGGTFDEQLVAGTCTLTSAGGTDGFVVSFDEYGDVSSCESVGGAGDDEVRTLTIDAFGEIVVGGSFTETVEFSSGVETSDGYEDGFVWRKYP